MLAAVMDETCEGRADCALKEWDGALREAAGDRGDDILIPYNADGSPVVLAVVDYGDVGEKWTLQVPGSDISWFDALAASELGILLRAYGVTHIEVRGQPSGSKYGDIGDGTYEVEEFLEWAESVE